LHKEYRESASRAKAGRQKETCVLTTASVCNKLVSSGEKREREREREIDSAKGVCARASLASHLYGKGKGCLLPSDRHAILCALVCVMRARNSCGKRGAEDVARGAFVLQCHVAWVVWREG